MRLKHNFEEGEFCFCHFQAPTSELNTFDIDFNCTTCKITQSDAMVFLLQVMCFAKLNKHPSLLSAPSLLSPPPPLPLKSA